MIDTPELDKQLQQARADLETSKSNLALAKITADRWQGLIKTRSVSQQSTDQATENLGAMQATLDSYAANVRRLEDLVSFEKVYAPFDGIITVRNTDIGWLDRRRSQSAGQRTVSTGGDPYTARLCRGSSSVFARRARGRSGGHHAG